MFSSLLCFNACKITLLLSSIHTRPSMFLNKLQKVTSSNFRFFTDTVNEISEKFLSLGRVKSDSDDKP